MPEREHFTNGRVAALGTGCALMATSFGAHIAGWHHWIAIGIGYGVGGVLVLLAVILITKSYYSRHPEPIALPMVADVPFPSVPSPWQDYPSEQAWREAVAEQDRLVELAHSVDGLFTPLQIEAFRLAKELGELQTQIEPFTSLSKNDYPDTLAGMNEYMAANSNAREEHEAKFRPLAAHYVLEIAPRVKQLMFGFEKEKINANQLMHFTQNIASDTKIPVLRSRLIALAVLVDGVKVGPEQANEKA